MDDAESVRGCLALMLRRAGYEVLEADDGMAALERIEREAPTLVISDLQMPGCSGWDLLTYCHCRHPELPVLIISGAALGRWPEIECWAAGFISKPFGFGRICETVQRLVWQAA